MEEQEKKFINVYQESNPNPNSLKFVLNFNILEHVQIEYTDIQSASNSPLAVALFEQFGFVQNVFMSSNFITLTKDDATEWFEVQSHIRDFIKNWFMEEKPVFLEAVKNDIVDSAPQEEDSEVVARIKTVLEDYVKPAVEQDGGAINFHSFDEGIVKVLLQGACSGCPSSTLTLKSGIENLLTRMVPEVKEVVAEGV